MEWLEKILNEVENKEELIKSIKKAIGENFVSDTLARKRKFVS